MKIKNYILPSLFFLLTVGFLISLYQNNNNQKIKKEEKSAENLEKLEDLKKLIQKDLKIIQRDFKKIFKRENKGIKDEKEKTKNKYKEKEKEIKEEKIEKKEKKKKLTDFDLFKIIHWPFYIKNECLNPKKCCNSLKFDDGGFTCYGIAINYNKNFFDLIKFIGLQNKKLKHIYLKYEIKDIKQTQNLSKNKRIKLVKEIMKKISFEDKQGFAQIYLFSKYFVQPKIVDLNTSWRQPVFDFTVHSGQKASIKVLQKHLGLEQDGIIGNKTIEASYLNTDYNSYNLKRYEILKKKPSYKRFKKGFDNRIEKIQKQSILAEKEYNKLLKGSIR